MKKSILTGSVLLIAGLIASSCNQSTEPSSAPETNTPTNTGNPGTGTGTTTGPGLVTIEAYAKGVLSTSDVLLDSARISITPKTAGDTIVYTTSGVDPKIDADVYTGPFPITGTTTFKAAARRGGVLGKVTTRTITITSQIFKPSFSTSRVDTFDAPVSVKITPANEATDTVYFTMSTSAGSPSRASTRSAGSVSVSQSTFLVARSFNGKNNPSDPETSQIVMRVAKLVPTAKSGNQNNVFDLFFGSKSPGISVHFTRDGSLPNCTNSELQKTDSILVDSNQTITAVGCRDGWTPSDTTKVSYTFKVGKVSTTPDSGIHPSQPQIVFNDSTPGATFFYTIDSTLPAWNAATLQPANSKTLKWKTGDAKIEIKSSIWLRSVGVKSGWQNSDTMTSRFVYIGDSALIDNFEMSGLGSKYGEKGLSWFACQYQNGLGCDQDQKFDLNRTLPLLDTLAPDYKKVLGFRAWRVQVGMHEYAEDYHAAYVGSSIRVPEEYPGNAYRLVFWAKFQDTSGNAPARMPLIIEMAMKQNAQNNGGYIDGYHRTVKTVGSTWEQFEVDLPQFYGAGNGYAGKQPDSTDDNPKQPALFFQDYSVNAIGLTGYQGDVGHNNFKPSWTFGVSKDDPINKGDISAFRFSVMQPMDTAVARTVGYSPTHFPHEPSFTQHQLDALKKNISGYLWIDNVRLVRKSVL